MSEVKLNEFDKDEWAAVYFGFKPDATEEEFTVDWEEFVQAKTQHLSQKGLQ